MLAIYLLLLLEKASAIKMNNKNDKFLKIQLSDKNDEYLETQLSKMINVNHTLTQDSAYKCYGDEKSPVSALISDGTQFLLCPNNQDTWARKCTKTGWLEIEGNSFEEKCVKGARCGDNPGCAHLDPAHKCCPAGNGQMLACCSKTIGIG